MQERIYSKHRSSRIIKLFVILVLVFMPFFDWDFVIYLITVSMIFGIFAIGYDLLYGYTGLLSLGHGVFYGIPAYVVGIVASTVFNIQHPLVLFGTAIASGMALGLLVGFFCTFTRGIYLAMVTFAFTQIFFFLVLTDPGSITYGENGIVGIRPPPVHLGGLTLDLFKDQGLYYLVFVLLLVSYLIVKALVDSQLGDIFIAIKQNEERLLSLGYNTRPYKILAFVLSGVFSAIAGVLMAFLNNNIVPSMVDWHLGAEIVLITILGGAGTLIGPIIGAFVIVFTESYASSWIGGGNWIYVLGGLYIGVVMFLPGGLIKLNIRNYIEAQLRRKGMQD